MKNQPEKETEMNANETYIHFKQMIHKNKRNIHVVFELTNSPTYQFIQIKNTFFNFVIGFSPLINLSKIKKKTFYYYNTSKPTKAFMNSRYCVVY